MLIQEIEEIRSGIKTGRFTSEAAVRQGIVLRLLQSLDWPTYNTQIVVPEYSVEGRRVDFALCHPPGKPVAFIEVKQIGQGDGGERQLFEYAFHKGIPMAILTTGQEWHFFLPAEQGDYKERRVYKLDIVEREVDEAVQRLQRYLNYQSICSGAAMKSAREDYANVARARQIEDILPEAWRKLVEDEDEFLLELLADRVESLCGYKPDPDTVAGFFRKSSCNDKTESRPLAIPTVLPNPSLHKTKRTETETGFNFKGKFHPARNGLDVLAKVFIELSNRDNVFLERFASLPKHGRTRRYLARSPGDLYPDRPDLTHSYSHEVKPGWWLGTNLSRAAISRIIQMACEVAGVQYGVDLTINLGG